MKKHDRRKNAERKCFKGGEAIVFNGEVADLALISRPCFSVALHDLK